MFKKFTLLIIIYFIFTSYVLSENKVYIAVYIDDEILTNQDIKKEAEYLKTLNPSLTKIDNKKIFQISKESLINEIIKKKEIEKIFDTSTAQETPAIQEYLKNFYEKLNFNNEKEFEIFLSNSSTYSIEEVKKKLKVEIMWNELIYYRYINQVNIDKDKLLSKIDKLNNKTRKEYELSEIVFKIKQNEDLEKKINLSISDIGFNNTANIFSISNSAKLGGKIGWVNESNLSNVVSNKLIDMNEGEITKPIKIGNNFIILKIEKIREKQIEINKEEELNKMIKFETNKQLNQLSKIFFDKSKINYNINEK